MLLKECKYIEKEETRHMNDILRNFSSSDYSDDSNEEQIKAMRVNAEFWLVSKSMIYNEISKQKSLYIN